MSERRDPTATPRAVRGVLWFVVLAATVTLVGLAMAGVTAVVTT